MRGENQERGLVFVLGIEDLEATLLRNLCQLVVSNAKLHISSGLATPYSDAKTIFEPNGRGKVDCVPCFKGIRLYKTGNGDHRIVIQIQFAEAEKPVALECISESDEFLSIEYFVPEFACDS